MAKTLTARGSDGRVAIHNPGANLDNPISDLGNIFFHSGLDYLTIVQTHNFTANFPAVGGNTFNTLMPVGYHGLGYVPMVFGRRLDTGKPIVGTCPYAARVI